MKPRSSLSEVYLTYFAALKSPLKSSPTIPTVFFPGASVRVAEETWLSFASIASSVTIALEASIFTKVMPVHPSRSILVNHPVLEPAPAFSDTLLPGWENLVYPARKPESEANARYAIFPGFWKKLPTVISFRCLGPRSFGK